MSKTIQVSEELAQLFDLDERLPRAFTEAAVLELFREHRISAGKAAGLLGLTYRAFLNLLQLKNIPIVTTPPRDPHAKKTGQYDTVLEMP
jgi:predicted HTH domain antitoxin